jgi:Cys-tRNA synthase (O-phospho-L-seryl-tRNA:Cys-tRNA synthase)
MSNRRFSDDWAVVSTIDPDAYGTGAQTSDVIDMQDWERIVVIVQGGTLGSSATLDAAVHYDTASNGSFTNKVTGKEITQMTEAGTDSDKQAIIEVTASEVAAMAAGARYARVAMTVGAATSDAGLLVLGRSAHYNPATDYDLASVDEIVG